jgi:D-amino-acid oxidase
VLRTALAISAVLIRSQLGKEPDLLMQDLDVIVVGSGVIGLTTGVVLQEAGLQVGILTRDRHRHTTSANSGAIWGASQSDIDSRVLSWSFQTLEEFTAISQLPGTGVEMVSGLGAADFETTTPDWVLRLGQNSSCDPSRLPANYVCGWIYSVPIIDMPAYLDYLARRFEDSGAVIRDENVNSIDELGDRAGHIVNCAGLGARELASDHTLMPCKGQLVVMENPGITEFFAECGDGPELMYILPQGDKVVLGGTLEWDYRGDELDEQVALRIVERCARVEPRLREARVDGYRVGIRPCRPTVRLEHEVSTLGTHVIHNYGHGGSGVSLSWACAQSVLDCLRNCGDI